MDLKELNIKLNMSLEMPVRLKRLSNEQNVEVLWSREIGCSTLNFLMQMLASVLPAEPHLYQSYSLPFNASPSSHHKVSSA